MAIKVLDFKGSSVSEESIPDIFKNDVNEHLIWEIIVAEQANLRQGTHKTKEKGEVRGGGKKPWRQKGTGRARAGSNRSPIWKGGGTTFGPRPRDYRQAIPQKKKRAGIISILTKKIQVGQIVILDKMKLDKVSTKDAFLGLTKVVEASTFYENYVKGRKLKANTNDGRRKVAFIHADDEQDNKRSLRNIPWVQYMHVDRLGALPLWHSHGIIITKDAYQKLLEKVK